MWGLVFVRLPRRQIVDGYMLADNVKLGRATLMAPISPLESGSLAGFAIRRGGVTVFGGRRGCQVIAN